MQLLAVNLMKEQKISYLKTNAIGINAVKSMQDLSEIVKQQQKQIVEHNQNLNSWFIGDLEISDNAVRCCS